MFNYSSMSSDDVDFYDDDDGAEEAYVLRSSLVSLVLPSSQVTRKN